MLFLPLKFEIEGRAEGRCETAEYFAIAVGETLMGGDILLLLLLIIVERNSVLGGCGARGWGLGQKLYFTFCVDLLCAVLSLYSLL